MKGHGKLSIKREIIEYMKKISILGSTGSIGTQTLEIVRYNRDIQVTALAAGSNIKMLEEQIREFHPQIVAVWSETIRLP